MRKKRCPHRMEIWFADLGSHPGSFVQEGVRPVLVVSNDTANTHAKTVTILPMTSKIKKPWLPTHVPLGSLNLVISPAYHKYFCAALVLVEQITTIDSDALIRYVGRVQSRKKQQEIDSVLGKQLGMVMTYGI